MTDLRNFAIFFINGQRYEARGDDIFMTVADFLRTRLHLTGTKIVCAEGDCGACTILSYRLGAPENFIPINACIMQMFQIDLCHILTVESVQNSDELSPVQCALVEHGGSQCGFCTPGFVMSLTATFEKSTAQTPQKIKNSLTGNLCRCTGYQPIIDAAMSVHAEKIQPQRTRFLLPDVIDELKRARSSLRVKNNAREIFAPLTLQDALAWKHDHPRARIVAGATDVGVAINKNFTSLDRVLSLHLIDELNVISEDEHGVISIGATITLAEMRRFMKSRCAEVANFLNIFASPQIKNVGTLVGNVANGSPIADMIPFLMAVDAEVHVENSVAARLIPMRELFRGYKSLCLEQDEIITRISFKRPSANQILRLYKVSQRKDLDIATVNAAFSLTFDDQRVESARIAIGGVAAYVVRIRKAEVRLLGQPLNAWLIDEVSQIIVDEITPLSDLRGSASYRRQLVQRLFSRYCHEVIAHDHA